ncbi:hypothetical protein ACQJBY_036401 [Aegilops geniculata]
MPPTPTSPRFPAPPTPTSPRLSASPTPTSPRLPAPPTPTFSPDPGDALPLPPSLLPTPPESHPPRILATPRPPPPPSLLELPEPQPPWIPASLHHLLHPTAAAAHTACARLRPRPGAGSAPRPMSPATRAPAPKRWLVGFPGRRWLVLPLATASSPAVHLRHLLKLVLFGLYLEEKRWFFTVLLVYANDVTRFS